MKNRKLVILSLFILSLFVVMLMLFRYLAKNNNEETFIGKYKELIVNKVTELEKENLGYLIKNQLVYFGDDSLNTFEIKKIVSGDQIFFYFSYNTCPPCLNYTIDLLKKYIPSYYEDDSIIFISPDYPKRFRNDCFGKQLLILQLNELGLPLERENVPFFFKINTDMQIVSLNIVIKEDFERTEKYIRSLFRMNY